VSGQAAASVFFGRLVFHGREATSHEPIEAQSLRRILIVRLDEIGDMVMFSPFLRNLRRIAPEAHITLVVKPAVSNLVENCPYVDEVLVFDQGVDRRLRLFVLPVRAFVFGRKRLGRKGYDLAILPRWDSDYYYAAFVAFWSGARRRLGYSEHCHKHKEKVNAGFDRLLTHVVQDTEIRHETERGEKLLNLMQSTEWNNSQEVWLTEQDHAFAEHFLAEHGVAKGDLLVGMAPAGGHSALKQWPLENFAAIGRWLQTERGATIVIVGGPGDAPLAAELQACLPGRVINAAGKTGLRELGAILTRCGAYLGNDSGPTHIASAAGLPLIALFGSSCRHRFAPLNRSRVVYRELACGPCHQGHMPDRCTRCIYDKPRCMHEITVSEVQSALETLLPDSNYSRASAVVV
jgi:ADP-heptose:LPS heptosyltransferase